MSTKNAKCTWDEVQGLDTTNQNTASLSFDGVDDYVDIGDIGYDLSNNPFSINVTFKWDGSTDTAQGIFQSREPDGDASIGNAPVQLFVSGGGDLFASFQDSLDNGHAITTPISPNVSYRAKVEWDGETGYLYLDNELVGSVDVTEGLIDTYVSFELGAWKKPRDRFFTGFIDELQIWNKISVDNNKSLKILNGDEEGLIGYWNCEDQATDLTDLTSNNNHGTINGATYSNDTKGIYKDGYNVYLKGENYALSLNGQDQYANLGQLGSFGSNHLALHTVEAKFISNDTTPNSIVGAYQDVEGGNQFGQVWQMRINQNSVGDVTVVVRPNGSTDGEFLSAYAVPSIDINDGEEHHVAIKVDKANGEVEILLDEEPLSITYLDQNTETNFVDWHIDTLLGANNVHRDGTSGVGNTNRLMNGSLKEVRIWKGLRTTQEIIDNADKVLDPANEPGLFRYYRCNSGKGNTLIDEVESDNGDLVGNMDGNMWSFWSGGIAFEKQNTSLIPTPEYIIKDLPNGEYEAYCTAVEGGKESDPSNVEMFEVGGGYKYYRLSIISGVSDNTFLSQFETPLRESIGGSNVAPDLAVAASSSDLNSRGAPINAFDGDNNTYWQSDSYPSLPCHVQVELSEETVIAEYGVSCYYTDYHQRSPKDWKLLGSKDGANWDILDEQSGVTNWNDGEIKYFQL